MTPKITTPGIPEQRRTRIHMALSNVRRAKRGMVEIDLNTDNLALVETELEAEFSRLTAAMAKGTP